MAQIESDQPDTMPVEKVGNVELPSYITALQQPEQTLQSQNASDEDRLSALDQLQKNEQKIAQQKVLSDAADMEKVNNYQQQLNRVNEFNQQAASRGLKPLVAPDPSKFGLSAQRIAELTTPEAQSQLQPVVQEAEQGRQIQNIQKEQEDLAIKQMAALQGQQEAQFKIQSANQQRMDDALKKLDSEQIQLDQIDPNRFWSNKSTFEKILGVIAIGFGAAGGGPNQALSIINNEVERDINAQKANADIKLALKQNALKRVQLEIQRFSELSQDAQRKNQMDLLAQQLGQQRQLLAQQQLMSTVMGRKLTDPQGMTRQEAEQFVTPDNRERVVSLPNGNVTLASSKDAASKLNTELKDGSSAITYIEQLKRAASEVGIGTKLTPAFLSKKKGEVNAIKQALTGALRIPFTGPGVLTDKEYERLSDTIGDPTDLFQTPGLAVSKLNAVENLLKAAQRQSYRNAGINVPLSKADQYRQLKLKEGFSPEQIEAALQKLGYK